MKTRTIARIAILLLISGLVRPASWAPEIFANAQQKERGTVVCASWYRVPPDSLARRRAGKNELTAAHNRLPLGTVVRVTNLSNDKSALVRITDRGIPRGQCAIDICQEAAEQLGMLREGIARVRLQVLPKSALAINPEEKQPASP